MFGFGRKPKKLTAKQAKKLVARDRKNWQESDQDDREDVVRDWLANGNDIQPDR